MSWVWASRMKEKRKENNQIKQTNDVTQTNDSMFNSTNKRCLLHCQFKRKSLNYTKTSAYIY